MSQQRITRDDIERSLRQVQSGVEDKVADKRKTILTAGGIALAIFVVLVYLTGRRAGRNKTTLVEIRRL
ncbi:MAG: hypothetical protein ACKO91_05810 [Acidimicrobiales bacterium]